MHRFSVKERDTRDPHFLVFRDRLFVYTGTWYCGPGTPKPEDYDLNQHLGFAAWSDDGTNWHSPVLLEGTFGHYIWRAASFNGKAYLCGRRKPGFEIGPRGEGANIQSLMLESEDGLIWRKRAFFQETAGDETAFLFERDGRVLAVGRHGGGGNAQLLRSKPPYTEWERTDLGCSIGGPLLVRWGERILVGGRKITMDKGPKTSLWWLADNKLKEFAELPSAGDNSYPGFVELSPKRALVSYYSSHEHDASGQTITAIYLVELTLETDQILLSECEDHTGRGHRLDWHGELALWRNLQWRAGDFAAQVAELRGASLHPGGQLDCASGGVAGLLPKPHQCPLPVGVATEGRQQQAASGKALPSRLGRS